MPVAEMQIEKRPAPTIFRVEIPKDPASSAIYKAVLVWLWKDPKSTGEYVPIQLGPDSLIFGFTDEKTAERFMRRFGGWTPAKFH